MRINEGGQDGILCRFILTLLLSVASLAVNPAAEGEKLDRIQRPSFAHDVATAIVAGVFTCPERIWPGTPWHRFQFLAVDHIGREAWLVRGNDLAIRFAKFAEITPVSYESLPVPFSQAGSVFAAGNLEGQQTFSVSRRRGADTVGGAVRLAVHEVFHYTGQSRFVLPRASAGRGLILPEDAELRYLRRMLLISLKDALVQGRSLSTAAHWFQKIKQRSATAQRFSNVDRTEGAAEYAAAMAAVIARAGCFASGQSLAAHASLVVSEFWDTQYQPLFESWDDIDSYALGAIAGVLLQLQGIEGWQARVEQGESMLEILLEKVAPHAASDDEGLRVRINTHYRAREQQLDLQLDAFFAAMRSNDNTIVAVSIAARSGGFSPTGGFVSAVRDGREARFWLATHARFLLLASKGALTLRGQDLLLTDDAACGAGDYLLFPIPQRAISGTTNARLSFSTDLVNAEGVGVDRREIGGARWLCLH